MRTIDTVPVPLDPPNTPWPQHELPAQHIGAGRAATVTCLVPRCPAP